MYFNKAYLSPQLHLHVPAASLTLVPGCDCVFDDFLSAFFREILVVEG